MRTLMLTLGPEDWKALLAHPEKHQRVLVAKTLRGLEPPSLGNPRVFLGR